MSKGGLQRRSKLLAALLFVVGVYAFQLFSYRQPVVAAEVSVQHKPAPAETISQQITHVRAAKGLENLEESQELTSVAVERAQDMVAHHYYDHVSPYGTTFMSYLEPSSSAQHACEVLSLSFSDSSEVIVHGWEQSTAHAACLFDTEAGVIGYAVAPYDLVKNYDGSLRQRYIAVAILSSN